ncbi:hypothetical protein [Pseudotabrizicola sp. L79]|uniref:hypothetical protein n=1 Tax=Pseudotabrizicola sp. L79 TaxID=3118402 RepID=UPI002F931402
MTRGLILLPLLLLGCGTPQERCIQRETRDLRTVERLIAETQANLDRGYAIEEVTVWRTRWVACPRQPTVALPEGAIPPRPQMCLDDEPETVKRPKAINLADERETLAGLQEKRADLMRAATPAIAQCKATYPE